MEFQKETSSQSLTFKRSPTCLLAVITVSLVSLSNWMIILHILRISTVINFQTPRFDTYVQGVPKKLPLPYGPASLPKAYLS